MCIKVEEGTSWRVIWFYGLERIFIYFEGFFIFDFEVFLNSTYGSIKINHNRVQKTLLP